MTTTSLASTTSTQQPPTAATFERPWGGFDRLALNRMCTVKIICVQPGHRLSLQRHHHRSEMWQVLDGPMDVQVDERTWTAHLGEQIWVPAGATHRMGNSTDVPARILEVAYGEFDEDDIERLEDDYQR